jgi:hypothetical protein
MALPWPSTGTDGKPLSHPWTGGPHAFYKGSDCLPADGCAKDVPKAIRSGLDFGTGGGPDWDVYAVGAGTLVYKGPLSGGFGAGAITQHGDLFVVYAHMAEASLGSAPAVGTLVDRGTKLGSTWCTGMDPCTAASGNHHLHLELRSGLSVAGTTISYGANVPWDGRTIGGWTIKAGDLNYNGTATACGTTITAEVAGPPIYDASTCGAPVTPPTVVSGIWVAPTDGATLTTSTLALSAKLSATSTTAAITRVMFSVLWGSVRRPACSAAKPDAQGRWTCAIDLWGLGAVPGPISFDFDVKLAGGQTIASPAGARKATFAAGAELVPSSGGCTGLVAGIDQDGGYHLIGDCSGKIRYWAAGPDGRWSLTKFAAPARGVEYGPIIAFNGETVYVFYTLVPDVEGGCGPGAPPISHPGVYYRKRALSSGQWSDPVQVGKDNDTLTSGRGSGGTFYLAIFSAEGKPYLERLLGSTASRVPLPGFGGEVLRIGSDGLLRLMYIADGGLRYGTLNGSSVSSQPVPGTDTFDDPAGLVLGSGDIPYAVFVRNHARGGGCVTPGPDPSDGVYVAIRTSGMWRMQRITKDVGPAAITVARDTGKAYVLVAGGSLELFRGGASVWSSTAVSPRSVGSPVLLLDSTAGGLLVGYSWWGSASGAGAGLYFQIRAR